MLKWLICVFFFFCHIHQGFTVSDVFINRHSGKLYDPARCVTEDQMRACIEAARWAPSSHNDQPWNFIICDKVLTPGAYEKALNSLEKESQKEWVGQAPVIVIVVARSIELKKKKINPWYEYDTGAAAISMALQATDLGLMAHQVGGFSREKIQEGFSLPLDCKPMTLMVIGYEMGQEGNVIRERRPIESNFFMGEWGRGYNSNP